MGRLVLRDFGSRERLDSTEQAIKKDPFAKKSYCNLQKKGLKHTDQFLELLTMAAVLALEGKAADSPKWYQDAWRASGKTPKTVASFPKRLKTVADEIEKVSAHPLFGPVEEFTNLPTILRSYADHVGERCRVLRQGRKGRPGTLGQVLVALRSFVRNETGKERHADVARLLTVVANDPGGYDFEACLKMNARRYPIRSA